MWSKLRVASFASRQVQANRERLQKIVALAINPGAIEAEAIAALHSARQLVKQNPALAHPSASPTPPRQDQPRSGPNRKDTLAQVAELSKLRANGSISDGEFRMLRIQVLKASLGGPIIAPDHDRREVVQPRPYVARAIGESIYTLLLNHVPGGIALFFVLKFSSPDTLQKIFDSGIFK
jgi:hypothetical protein